MKHLIQLLICVLFLTGCTCSKAPANSFIIKTFDTEQMSRLMLYYAAELEDEYRLILEDSRVVYDKDNILRICIEFSSQALLTMCEARLLMVKVVEGFLTRLNNHTELSFQLASFPFTADNLDIKINFESFEGFYVDPLYIGIAWLKSGCVHYYAFDIKDIYADWSHQRFEPYFKSKELALIKEEADIPFEDRDNPPRRPREYIYDRYLP